MSESLPNSEPAHHRWDISPTEAKQLQLDLRARVSLEDIGEPVQVVAGVDVGYKMEGFAKAAVVTLNLPELTIREQAVADYPLSFPYLPGLLSFREAPAILAALQKLEHQPDLVICDGQGVAHPRRFGIACHLGVLTGLRCIGVAKKRLIGTHDDLPEEKGSWVALRDQEETVGAVVRTRSGVKPVFVSPGHRVSLESAVARIMDCVTRYRLPETTRQADRLSRCDKLSG